MAKYQGKDITIVEPAVVIKVPNEGLKTVPIKEVTFTKEELFQFIKGKM